LGLEEYKNRVRGAPSGERRSAGLQIRIPLFCGIKIKAIYIPLENEIMKDNIFQKIASIGFIRKMIFQ
jgi:hypothetical protein